MAISPKAKYPGNVAITDVAYPYGKARNQNNPGDGSGTPLEEAWVNDVWGFLQALLGAVGVIPSGTPDKVGASQYLTAIQTLIGRLKTTANTWTQAQSFLQNIDLATNAIILLRGQGGVFYNFGDDDAPVRSVMVPLNPISAVGWEYVPGDAPGTSPCWRLASGSAPWITMLSRDVLPSGARIKSVRASCVGSVSAALSANQTRFNFGSGAPGTHETAVSESFTLTSTAHVFSLATPDAGGPDAWIHNNDGFSSTPFVPYSDVTQLRIKLTPSVSGIVALQWIEVDYYDTVLTNT